MSAVNTCAILFEQSSPYNYLTCQNTQKKKEELNKTVTSVTSNYFSNFRRAVIFSDHTFTNSSVAGNRSDYLQAR